MAALHEDLAPAGGSPGPSSRFDHWIVVLAAVLAFVGLCLAGYLAFENLQAKTGVCTITHGCATVQQSRYGKPFGIPISVPGLALYLALFGLAVTWLKDARHLRAQATALAFFAAEAGFVVSVYLTYIEGWVLDAWCIYCITSACLMTALALLWLVVLIRTARRRSSEASQG
jgi:uncharacterized membrane protein